MASHHCIVILMPNIFAGFREIVHTYVHTNRLYTYVIVIEENTSKDNSPCIHRTVMKTVHCIGKCHL